MPTLVISEKYDGVNPPAVGKEIASLIPGGQYLELEHFGYYAYREEPKALAEAVKAFIE